MRSMMRSKYLQWFQAAENIWECVPWFLLFAIKGKRRYLDDDASDAIKSCKIYASNKTCHSMQ